MRLEQEIFDELAALCVSPGYIHALAWMCFRDTVVGFADELNASDFKKMYSQSTLIRTELTTLMGLLIQQPIDFVIPNSEAFEKYVARSDILMSELHRAMIANREHATRERITNPSSRSFDAGDIFREAVFYSAESAYPFQYRDLAPIKYLADSKWLEENYGFNMQAGSTLVKALIGLLNGRLMTTLKALREKPAEQWTMLPGFTFTVAEIATAANLPFQIVSNIITAFAGPIEGCNSGFRSLHAFNIASALPFIRKGPDEYVLLQYYGCTEALYDAPFYWMCNDAAYRNTAFQHRGNFTEDFSYERLLAVFGRGRAFKNVDILRDRSNTLGEIDVLVLFGDQAIVLQAKSKKLTLEARNGNDRRLRGDFQTAVQGAVDQAFSCAAFIGDQDVILRCRDGALLRIATRPKTIYPVTVVADHYPMLAFQARHLLKYSVTDQIVAPLVMDIFALDVITEMLSTPLRLLSYLRLRAKFTNVFMISHENTLLSYHLKTNLWQGESDMIMVGDDVSSDLNIAMAARRDNVPGAITPAGILTAFLGTPFSQIVAQIEDQDDPAAIAVGFFLLELSGDTVKKLSRYITRFLKAVNTNGEMHDVTMGFSQLQAGITIHVNDLPTHQANRKLYEHCRRRKYSEKAITWYGIALRPDGTINLAAVLAGLWEFDSALEATIAAMPARKAGIGPKPAKPGRNSLCSCGSGRKFKRCHGP